MTLIHNIRVDPPLINSSCPWASEFHQLDGLYNCPWTGAVTTRTATLNGFSEDSSHTVVFAQDSLSTLNSYGYSPHPLSVYLEWIHQILSRTTQTQNCKPFIISITSSSPSTLSTMLDMIQELRVKLQETAQGNSPSRIAIELNTSCPNIRGSPPPAYAFSSVLLPLLHVLAEHHRRDPTLTIGLKLAPFVSQPQFEEAIATITSLSRTDAIGGETYITNPFAYFACTNTLGSSLFFVDQTASATGTTAQGAGSAFALPTVLGGLAGEAIHALSLGNVYTFSQILSQHTDEAMRNIKVIGIGGVTSPESVQRMKDVGACVVGCATLLGKEGVAGFHRLSD